MVHPVKDLREILVDDIHILSFHQTLENVVLMDQKLADSRVASSGTMLAHVPQIKDCQIVHNIPPDHSLKYL